DVVFELRRIVPGPAQAVERPLEPRRQASDDFAFDRLHLPLPLTPPGQVCSGRWLHLLSSCSVSGQCRSSPYCADGTSSIRGERTGMPASRDRSVPERWVVPVRSRTNERPGGRWRRFAAEPASERSFPSHMIALPCLA